MLISFVSLYMLLSIAIGLSTSSRIKSSIEYILANRKVPLYMTVATVFATWFGSESIIGIPNAFINDGIVGIIAEPFGTGLCLIIVGIFYAAKLYQMELVTIGDFYRKRFGRTVEVMVSLAICVSYLGWLSAQIVALGLVIKFISQNSISLEVSMLIGLIVIMLYTILGGMKSLVVVDFIQMILIILGLIAAAIFISSYFSGGVIEVVSHAITNKKFSFSSLTNYYNILEVGTAFLSLSLGSIPQQDVFQRVMSAKNERTAVLGSVIGGILYILFCFIPIFILYSISLLDPELFKQRLETGIEQQVILIEYISKETPILLQVLFFGALLSAIMSTASGSLLAPSVLLANNLLKDFINLSDQGVLLASRGGIFMFGSIVYFYSCLSVSAGVTILEIIKNSYFVTLCGAFIPLTLGLYWNKANKHGAILSIALGIGTWTVLTVLEKTYISPPLAGFLASIIGMLTGSHFKIQKNNY